MQTNNDAVPVKGIIPLTEMYGDDAEDIRLLRMMALDAEAYLRSRPWCKEIRDSYFGDGYGGIAAVFFFRILPAQAGVDEWLWVVIGDIPPAYLVIDDCKTPSEAMTGYIEEMSKWVDLAKKGQESNAVIPVNVPATPENASDLEKRLKFLSDLVVPAFQEGETLRS